MNHYEIILLIHPDQDERVQSIIKKYKTLIENGNGKVYRLEDLGKKQLAYQIKKVHKAHYVLMNIECNQNILQELQSSLNFNDAIIRNLVLKTKYNINIPPKTSISQVRKNDSNK